jgi:hypothetical protein
MPVCVCPRIYTPLTSCAYGRCWHSACPSVRAGTKERRAVGQMDGPPHRTQQTKLLLGKKNTDLETNSSTSLFPKRQIRQKNVS